MSEYKRLTRRIDNGLVALSETGLTVVPILDRLAEYEDIGGPEELRWLKSVTAAFEGQEEPSEDTIAFLQDGHRLRQWIKRCAWHCQKVNEQSIEIRRLKAELDALHKPRITWSDNVDIDERN